MLKRLLPMLFALLLTNDLFAKVDLDYPELQVVPLASQRILMEVKRHDSKLLFNWGVTASASMTLAASLLQFGDVNTYDDVNKASPKVGLAVGVTWLATNAILSYKYNGYLNALHSLKKMPNKTKAQILARERAAEEYINELGSLGKKIKWMSFLTNFAASAYMLSNVESDSKAEVADALALVFSFAPLLFESRWEKVRDIHADYKKKIYAPIIGTTFYDAGKKGLVPGLLVGFTF